MNLPWIQAVRIVQIIFGLIVVALTAYGSFIPHLLNGRFAAQRNLHKAFPMRPTMLSINN